MAGKKGCSGSKPGAGNNPNGRPLGSKNKVQLPLKKRIVDYMTDEKNFNSYIDKLNSLDNRDFVKAWQGLFELVIAKPVNESEDEANKAKTEMIKRLFNKE